MDRVLGTVGLLGGAFLAFLGVWVKAQADKQLALALAEQQTKADVSDLSDELRGYIVILEARNKRADERYDRLEQRYNDLDTRYAALEQRNDELEETVMRLQRQLDKGTS